MIIIVTGDRTWRDGAYVFAKLDLVHACYDITRLAHGGADGVDHFAGAWAASRGIMQKVHAARWATQGDAAGHIRNALMYKEEKPQLLVAFPGGNGTRSMIKMAERGGTPVLRFTGQY